MTLPWMAERIQLRAIASLRPHAGNARVHDEAQLAQIMASMQAFGFTNPLLVDEDGVLIAGHGRLAAAEALGIAKVPVIVLKHLAPAQKEALRLADNRIAENATWDQTLLRDALASVQAAEIDLAALGFSADELAGILAAAAPRDQLAMVWRKDADGTPILIQVTDEGLRAIGIDPNEGRAAPDTAPQGGESPAPQPDDAEAEQPAHAAPEAPNMGSVNLREAAERLLAAWEATPPKNANDDPVAQAMAMLRSALTRRGTRATGAPRKPREGTKQEVVLAILRRPEGATVAQIAEATGWAQHTVRGFFAGLKKRQGITVEIAERIRQVGPNKQGAKGSYTVYRVAE